MKANELLEKTQRKFQIFASADYLSQLYYSDFSDKLKSQSDKVAVSLVTDDGLKSAYFLGQLNWLSDVSRIVDNQNLPCFMVSDDKEVLIAFHEEDSCDSDTKKKFRTAAIWTNYSVFVKTLQMLFTKLSVN
jgi:hypothetical protein